MVHFDVHGNRGANRDLVPYVVVAQSAPFDELSVAVVPLVKKAYLDKVAVPCFNPAFVIEGTPVILQPLKVVSVATNTLGRP